MASFALKRHRVNDERLGIGNSLSGDAAIICRGIPNIQKVWGPLYPTPHLPSLVSRLFLRLTARTGGGRQPGEREGEVDRQEGRRLTDRRAKVNRQEVWGCVCYIGVEECFNR